MVRTTADDARDEKLLSDIATYGWHCLTILEDAGHVAFSFTVGLYRTYGHPELIMLGLRPDIAHGMFSIAIDHIRRGGTFDAATPTALLAEGYDCLFAPVPRNRYRDYVGYGLWYYEGDDFPLWQIVWPSREGGLPWDADASEEFRHAQPLIGIPHQAPERS